MISPNFIHFFYIFLLFCIFHAFLAQNLFQKCKSSYLDIAFVLDASPSVDSNEWTDSINFLSEILPYVNNPESRGSIFQYNYNAYRELNLTNNWSLFNDTLHKFKRNTDQSTQTGLALSFAYQHLKEIGRTDALPMIFILTDGEPYDSIISKAEEIKRNGVIIVIIAVDEARTSNTLLNVASSSLFFSQEKYDELTDNFILKVSSAICFDLLGVLEGVTNDLTNKITVDLMSSKKILIKGRGFFDSTSCQYISINSSNVSYTFPMINYNLSMGSCQIPYNSGEYNLTLKSIYWRTLTESNAQIQIKLSQLIPVKDSLILCQGEGIDFIRDNLRSNWYYFNDQNTWNYTVTSGCSTNEDCPYNNYCFNCSLCKNSCPGCPSTQGGSCFPIKDCYVRNDSIKTCKKISDPCDCSSSYSPFNDEVYLANSDLECNSINQCYIQDSKNCNLPNITKNSQTYKKCLKEIDNSFTSYCEWSYMNAESQINPDNNLTEAYKNQAYIATMDSNPVFLKFSNQNINFKSCFQRCIEKLGCSAIEYPNDGSYCGLWMNGTLKNDSLSWRNNFQGTTYVIKIKEISVMIPAIYKSNNVFTCPIPSRFSIKANMLKLRVLEKNNDDFIAITQYKSFQWSYCSNCSDLFSDNFDNFNNNNNNLYDETCFYQDGSIKQYKINDNPEYFYISKEKINFNEMDNFNQYPMKDCNPVRTTDYVMIESADMTPTMCAKKCLEYQNCTVFENSNYNYRKCYLWLNITICNTKTMYYSLVSNMYVLQDRSIHWTDLLTTNNSIYGFYLNIHKMKFSMKYNNSIVKLYFRELNSNITYTLFDTNLYDNNMSMIILNKLKFIDGNDVNNHISDIKASLNNLEFNETKIIHSMKKFLPFIINNGKPLIFQIGIEQCNMTRNLIDILGVTMVVTDWGVSSDIKKSIIPSKNITNCTVLQETVFSIRQNKTVPKKVRFICKKTPMKHF